MLKIHQFIGLLSRVFLMADQGGQFTGYKPPTPQPAPQPLTEEQRKAQIRKQSEQAAQTLRQQAEARAKQKSDSTGQPAPVEKTPTAEELYQEALKGAGFTEQGTLSGPTPAKEFRPGETVSGPATGRLAIGAPVPEHMASQVIPTTPTVNAPGLGADTGIKKTADNADVRPGPPDPADRVPTPEVPTPGAEETKGHGSVRLDTPEVKAAREALDAKVARGEDPTAEELKKAGVPDAHLAETLEAGKAEAKRVRDAQAAAKASQAAAEQKPADKPADKPAEGKQEEKK